MEKLEQGGVGKVKDGDINWVQSSLCSGWYHCVCVGMAHGFVQAQEVEFCCCKISTSSTTFVTCIYQFYELSSCGGCRVLRVPVLRRKVDKSKQISLFQSDVQSLYPGRGLTDGVLDFFIRWYFTTLQSSAILPRPTLS